MGFYGIFLGLNGIPWDFMGFFWKSVREILEVIYLSAYLITEWRLVPTESKPYNVLC